MQTLLKNKTEYREFLTKNDVCFRDFDAIVALNFIFDKRGCVATNQFDVANAGPLSLSTTILQDTNNKLHKQKITQTKKLHKQKNYTKQTNYTNKQITQTKKINKQKN